MLGDSSNEYNGVITRQNLKDNRSAKELIDEAIKISQDADYVIFIGGLNKSAGQDCEDADRKGIELPYNQDKSYRSTLLTTSELDRCTATYV